MTPTERVIAVCPLCRYTASARSAQSIDEALEAHAEARHTLSARVLDRVQEFEDRVT